MRGRLRLLPILIFSATCLLSIKVIDLADGLIVHVPTLAVGETMAAADPEGSAAAEGDAEALPDAEAAAAQDAEGGDAEGGDAEGEAAEGDIAGAGTSIDSIVMALGEELPYQTPPLPLGDRGFEAVGTEQPVYTPEELAVLQALGERRAELDAREAELEARERQLAVAEQRIDQKIAELAALQARIEELLQAYDAQEDEQLMSLVKIYETMKPKDAAPIFNSLDLEILLEIISRMSNIRSAPILAQMDPLRAQQVTEELARRMQERPDFMAEPADE
jgi:flagellar motility protein MotE (MotC chaperone)